MSPDPTNRIIGADELGRRERPVLVWVIVSICVLGVVVPWLTYVLVGFNVVSVTNAAHAYFAGTAASYYMFSAAYSAVAIAAAASLFLLKKAAPYLFIANLALYLLSIRLFETPETHAGLGSYSNPPEFTKLAFQLAVIYYCFRLKRRGVLA